MRNSLSDVVKLASAFDLSEGNCLLPKYTRDENGDPIMPSLWEGRLGWETPEEVYDRHEKALRLCRNCPCLEACKSYVAAVKDRRFSIDGVVAGEAPKTMHTRQCTNCGVEIVHRTLFAPGMDAKPEAARGMCEKCYRAQIRKKHLGNSRKAVRAAEVPEEKVA